MGVELEFAFQKAVFSALSEQPELTALLAAPGIYDRVPPPDPNEAEAAYRKRVPMPYVSIGEDDFLDDSTGCAFALEANPTIHVWSQAVGKTEAKRIGARVREALDRQLTIEGAECTEFAFVSGRYFLDPDGVTTHGVLAFRYLLDPY